MNNRVPCLAAIIENPIQYHSPLYRYIAEDGRIHLKVFYLTDRGMRPFQFEGMKFQHERSLLEGYEWELLKNRSPWEDSFGFLDNFDTGIVRSLKGFDAVWFHGWNYATHWLGFATCRLRGIPILLRGEFENILPRPALKRACRTPLLASLFSGVTAFLPIGSHNRNFYKSYGVTDEKLFDVPYGVDNSWFQGAPGEPATWRDAIRRELAIASETTVFIYTSKHRFPKQPLHAVKAFCSLPAENDAVLLMLGDGPKRAEAEEYFRAHGNGHRLRFLGMQPYPELRKFLAAADALVFPSSEPWGMAISEALAAGLAIISSDEVVGAIDMVIPGANGFIYKAGDVGELGRLIAYLSGNKALVEQMRTASLAHSDRFSFRVAVDGLFNAMTYVTSQRFARRPPQAAGAARC